MPGATSGAVSGAITHAQADETRHVLVGQSPRTRQVLRLIDKLGKCRWPALLLGETGTGKEVVARAIHADRMRDLERAARDHRYLAAAADQAPARDAVGVVRTATPTKPAPCGDSAGVPA